MTGSEGLQRPSAFRLALQSYATFFRGLRAFWPYMAAYFFLTAFVSTASLSFMPEKFVEEASYVTKPFLLFFLDPYTWLAVASIPCLIWWHRSALNINTGFAKLFGVVCSARGCLYVAIFFGIMLLVPMFELFSPAIDNFLLSGGAGIDNLRFWIGLIGIGITFISLFVFLEVAVTHLLVGLAVDRSPAVLSSMSAMSGFRAYSFGVCCFVFAVPALLFCFAYVFADSIFAESSPLVLIAFIFGFFVVDCVWAIAQAEIYRLIESDSPAGDPGDQNRNGFTE